MRKVRKHIYYVASWGYIPYMYTLYTVLMLKHYGGVLVRMYVNI